MNKVRLTVCVDRDLVDRLAIAKRDSGVAMSQLVNRVLRREIHYILNFINMNIKPEEIERCN